MNKRLKKKKGLLGNGKMMIMGPSGTGISQSAKLFMTDVVKITSRGHTPCFVTQSLSDIMKNYDVVELDFNNPIKTIDLFEFCNTYGGKAGPGRKVSVNREVMMAVAENMITVEPTSDQIDEKESPEQ